MAKWINELWSKIGHNIINIVKIHILENNIQDIFRFFSNKLNMIRRRYSRQLPYHVVESEADDLDVIAQLELVETIKVWNSIENEDLWPLAQARIVGAFRDHIRYLTKTDPTRVYEWVVGQAQSYISSRSQRDHVKQYDLKDQLRFAMKELSERERWVIRAHTKQDLTFKVIGEQIGLSESQVSRIYKKAVTKIKQVIQKDQ